MKNGKDVIIIGAGVAGLFTAYYLNKAGYSVTIADKDCGKNNCSYGNAGMIVPSHIIPLASPGMIRKGLTWMLNEESPFYIRPRFNLELLRWGWKFREAATRAHVDACAPVLKNMLMTSRELLLRLEQEENLEFGFVKKGLFMFCNSQKGLDEEAEVAEKAKSIGIPASVLTREEVKKMVPELKLNITGATWFPKDAHLHPGTLLDKLKTLLKQRGVRFCCECEITTIKIRNGRVSAAICKDGREWKGSEFIITAGIWSSALSKTIKKRIPMQAGKGYSITLKNPKKLPQHCGILAEEKVTMTPMFEMLRFGGTMEIVGTDKHINPKKITGLKKSVCRYLPEFEMADLNGHDIWVGLRPISPDGMPYVGQFNGIKNLYVSTGHAMMGMSLAPSSGKLIAELITSGKSGLEHPLMNPDRFGQ